ncbi:MAG: Hydroxyacylglutathione hydrolase GloC [Chlamydiia bacterium]|nr:Hydroxyacylglutathione hydrolase GloC [Chlamydiia bacterium]
MHIDSFPTGPFDTNVYIIYLEQSRDAIIIDPGFNSFSRILEIIKNKSLKPQAIWLTHSHWDHVSDVAPLKKELSIPIYIHGEDKQNLIEPGSDKLPMLVPLFEKATPDHIIKDYEILNLGNLEFKVIHTPGHSPGSVCFYNEKENTLISGDTIFKGAIGSLSLPTGEPKRMWPSLEKLAKLPAETKVYPGHGPSTVLENEKWILDAKNHQKESFPTHISMEDS